jgi:hypothetical protein
MFVWGFFLSPFFLIIIILDLYVFNIVYKVGKKQHSSEMVLQTSQVTLTFAHLMCLLYHTMVIILQYKYFTVYAQIIKNVLFKHMVQL